MIKSSVIKTTVADKTPQPTVCKLTCKSRVLPFLLAPYALVPAPLAAADYRNAS